MPIWSRREYGAWCSIMLLLIIFSWQKLIFNFEWIALPLLHRPRGRWLRRHVSPLSFFTAKHVIRNPSRGNQPNIVHHMPHFIWKGFLRGNFLRSFFCGFFLPFEITIKYFLIFIKKHSCGPRFSTAPADTPVGSGEWAVDDDFKPGPRCRGPKVVSHPLCASSMLIAVNFFR